MLVSLIWSSFRWFFWNARGLYRSFSFLFRAQLAQRRQQAADYSAADNSQHALAS